MRTLNLVNPKKGDIEFEIVRFPDKQVLVNLKVYQNYHPGMSKEPVKITTRLLWDDLQVLIAAVEALREIGVDEIHLFAPYIIGARSDRKFQSGSINYMKTVIGPLINGLNFKTVQAFDPHSDVMEAVIDRFKPMSNDTLVARVCQVNKFYARAYKEAYWLVPDGGALKKVYNCPSHQNFKDIVICSKHRDIKSGEIVATTCPMEDFGGLDVVIVDDICDGGRTFIELAKLVRPRNIGKLYLVVSHGIFSKGIDPLREYFDCIYTTDSFQTINDPLVINAVEFF